MTPEEIIKKYRGKIPLKDRKEFEADINILFNIQKRRRQEEVGVYGNLLKEANELIRSFHSVIERGGSQTNWHALEKKTKAILKKQHLLLGGIES